MNGPDIPDWLAELIARITGSSTGAGVAVVFAQPKTRKEFWQRLVVCFVVGLIFGPNAIPYLGMLHIKDDINGLIGSGFLVGFSAWLLLGYATQWLRARAEAQLQK